MKQAASGEHQARADRMAARLRQGMEEILERARVAGYAYGDSSVFHVYLEAFPGSGASSRDALRTRDPAVLKGIPSQVISALQKNMQIRGVKLLSYNGGVTSSAHTEEDIDLTLEGFQGTVDALVEEQVVGRLG